MKRNQTTPPQGTSSLGSGKDVFCLGGINNASLRCRKLGVRKKTFFCLGHMGLLTRGRRGFLEFGCHVAMNLSLCLQILVVFRGFKRCWNWLVRGLGGAKCSDTLRSCSKMSVFFCNSPPVRSSYCETSPALSCLCKSRVFEGVATIGF